MSRDALPALALGQLAAVSRVNSADVTRLIEALATVEVRPLPIDHLPVRSRDPKDDYVLAMALGAAADVIVTGDADLFVLEGHSALATLHIMTLRSFIELLHPQT